MHELQPRWRLQELAQVFTPFPGGDHRPDPVASLQEMPAEVLTDKTAGAGDEETGGWSSSVWR